MQVSLASKGAAQNHTEEPATTHDVKPDMRETAGAVQNAAIIQGTHREGGVVCVLPHTPAPVKNPPSVACVSKAPVHTPAPMHLIAPQSRPSSSLPSSPPAASVHLIAPPFTSSSLPGSPPPSLKSPRPVSHLPNAAAQAAAVSSTPFEPTLKNHAPKVNPSTVKAQDSAPEHLRALPLPPTSSMSPPPKDSAQDAPPEHLPAPTSPPSTPSPKATNPFSTPPPTPKSTVAPCEEAIIEARAMAVQFKKWATGLKQLSRKSVIASKVHQQFKEAVAIEVINGRNTTTSKKFEKALIALGVEDNDPRVRVFAMACTSTHTSIKSTWFEIFKETASLQIGKGNEEQYKCQLKRLIQKMETTGEIFTKIVTIFEPTTPPAAIEALVNELHTLADGPILKTTPSQLEALHQDENCVESERIAQTLRAFEDVDDSRRIVKPKPLKSTWDKVWDVCYAYKGCENGWVIFKVVMVVLSIITLLLLPLTLWVGSQLYDCCQRRRSVERL